MSAPCDGNPDKRSLPPGWITQYDSNYGTWFYVNTAANPPVTTWNHPLGPPSSNPSLEPKQYSAPPGPPVSNNSSTYPGGYNPAGGQSYPGQNSYPQQQPLGNYGDSLGAGTEQKGLGGLLGRLTGGGRPGYIGAGRPDEGRLGGGGYMAGGGYPTQQQQPQVVYVQQPPQKSGIGMGGLALGAGAGLLGGALLADAFDDRNDCDYGGDGFGDDGGDFGGDFF